MNIPNKVGRPSKEIDLDLLKSIAAMQCSDAEIAACLGLSLRTWMYKKAANPELAEIIKQGEFCGKASIKREQFRQAMKGNTAMLIWLGKNYAGQHEAIQRHQIQQVKPIEQWTDDELDQILLQQQAESVTGAGAQRESAAPEAAGVGRESL